MTMTQNTPEAQAEQTLGSRLLYLRTPNFRGADVEQLQGALGALGFACGGATGVFDAYTEGALRKFQLNMGLEQDGIAGKETYEVLNRLRNAWRDKPQIEEQSYMSLARVATVLERHAVVLFGTCDYTRRIANYVSNLALATNPRSKVVSAESLLVPPSQEMLLTKVAFKDSETDPGVPRVLCDDVPTLPRRMRSAMEMAGQRHQEGMPARMTVEVPQVPMGTDDASADQMAHHEAVQLLDALCAAFV